MIVEREILSESVLTPKGWVSPAKITLDSKGYIESVSPLDESDYHVDLSGPVLAGMPNLHSHAFQRQMAGLTEVSGQPTDNFWTWREVMYKLANRISPEQLQSIAAWLQAEMLEAGFTSCGEFHYVHHQPTGMAYDNRSEMSAALVRAADQSGISLTLLPVLYCRSGFDSLTVNEGQKRFFNTPETFNLLMSDCRSMLAEYPQHRLGMAAHSLRAASVEQIQEVIDAQKDEIIPIHIHIAEQTAEVEECQSTVGARPVDYLLDSFPVDENWCLVHATHLEENELERAAASGAVAGLCPVTEANLGDGFFEAEHWLQNGGSMGVGTDSNIQVSVIDELRLLEYGSRLRNKSRNVLSSNGQSCGRSLYGHALKGGTAALGHHCGRIEAGFRADLVELDSSHPFLQDRKGDQHIDSWIFSGDPSMVRSVWVSGKKVVQESRHILKSELEKPFRQAMKALL